MLFWGESHSQTGGITTPRAGALCAQVTVDDPGWSCELNPCADDLGLAINSYLLQNYVSFRNVLI